jgi:hypothetical protein
VLDVEKYMYAICDFHLRQFSRALNPVNVKASSGNIHTPFEFAKASGNINQRAGHNISIGSMEQA